MKLIDRFEQALKMDFGFSAERNRNFITIAHRNFSPFTLYVKESNLDVGFWGINKNQIDYLVSKKNRWAVVLLARNHHLGFFLNPKDVKNLCEAPSTYYSKNDFKVHEQKLSKEYLFESLQEMILKSKK